jgi:GT2 family glycosyltransferase
MKLLVVVVSYRVTDLTIDCLRSLSTEIHRVPRARVAICENGTGGDAAQRIQGAIDREGWGEWATLEAIHPNLGFTGGNNVILRPALSSPDPPDYFHLLNADTVVRPHALDAMIDFLDAHPHVGIAGSRLEDPDGTPQRSAFRFQTPLSEFERGARLGLVSKLLANWVVAPPPPVEATRTDWVAGASLFVRRQVFEQIGVLDEDYYTYFDDIDLCFNAAKAGWQTWYVPQSRVVHLVGQTTGVGAGKLKRFPQYALQARRHHFLKNYGPFYAALADAAYLTGFGLWRLRRVFQGTEDIDPPQMLQDALRNSVFITGFRKRPVQNPALLGTVTKKEA